MLLRDHHAYKDSQVGRTKFEDKEQCGSVRIPVGRPERQSCMHVTPHLCIRFQLCADPGFQLQEPH